MLVIAVIIYSGVIPAGPPKPNQPQETSEKTEKLDFSNAPLQMVLDYYADLTGRTILKDPKVPAVNITLRSQTPLTAEEALQAIDAVLGMHGIGVLKEGTKFLRVVPIAKAREEPMDIIVKPEVEMLKETSELTSLMIPLKHIDINEAMKVVKPFQHSAYGQFTAFERINSILVTDTAANLNRIVQILKFVDQPVEIREEPHIIKIKFAKAADIKKKLEEIIAEAQKTTGPSVTPSRPAPSGPPVMVKEPPPGVIRPPVEPAPGVVQEPEESREKLIEMAERGVIKGKVKIIADERTNVLLIITRPENMVFFEKIVNVLDVETEPDVVVKIIRLEYADAENIANTLNTLIGAIKDRPIPTTSETTKPGQQQPAQPGSAEARSAALNEYLQRLQESMRGEKETARRGELSAANLKILPDKRTNALLIMGVKSDVAAIEEIVKSMDTMLSQVLIEAVIFKITLDNTSERGIDWVQRALIAYEQKEGGRRSPRMAFAGAGGGDTYRGKMMDPLTAVTLPSLSSTAGNLTYYFTFFHPNVDAIIKLVAADKRTKILSSPVILTTDNKEAKISVTKEKYFYKGQKFVSTSGSGAGEWVDDVEMKRVGTKLTVTPHINQKKHVVMDITQSLEEEGAGQEIRGAGGVSTWPTIDAADMTAQVAVRSGETIVLGGLVTTTLRNDGYGIPILRDIPLIGNLFKYDYLRNERAEVLVFITPYVLNTPEEIESETIRRRNATSTEDMWPEGWSASKLGSTKKEQTTTQKEKFVPQSSTSSKTPEVISDSANSYVQPNQRSNTTSSSSTTSERDLIRFLAEENAKWEPINKKVDAIVQEELKKMRK
jgi:general secretion pathway protein D